MPNVAQILSDLNKSVAAPAAPTTKVASAAPQAQAPQAPAPQAPSAVDALTKIASDLAAADGAQLHKEASLYGAAVFDGFIMRANQYAANAPTPGPEKIASYADYANSEQALWAMREREKQAAEAAYQEKLAMEAGYQDAAYALQSMVAQQKTAAAHQAEYERGVLAGAEKIASLAEDSFNRGFEHMRVLHAQL